MALDFWSNEAILNLGHVADIFRLLLLKIVSKSNPLLLWLATVLK